MNFASRKEVETNLGIEIDENTTFVGFSSDNTIANKGTESWTKDSGLLSIWILGMFVPSPATTVVIPYHGDLNLNTSYFGEIGDDRLKVSSDAIFFQR